MITYKVPQRFIDQREERQELYGAHGRTPEKHARDIECELYEYYHLKRKRYTDDDAWQIDMISPDGDAIDCKCITKWYNINQWKFKYLLQQREHTTHFEFWEWVDRPDRLLVQGDVVQMRKLCRVPFWDVISAIKPSKFNGFYVDVRKEFA